MPPRGPGSNPTGTGGPACDKPTHRLLTEESRHHGNMQGWLCLCAVSSQALYRARDESKQKVITRRVFSCLAWTQYGSHDPPHPAGSLACVGPLSARTRPFSTLLPVLCIVLSTCTYVEERSQSTFFGIKCQGCRLHPRSRAPVAALNL